MNGYLIASRQTTGARRRLKSWTMVSDEWRLNRTRKPCLLVMALQPLTFLRKGSEVVMSEGTPRTVESLRHWLDAAYGRARDGARHTRELWQALDLAQQFVACASLVLLPAMLVIGLWVSQRIEESVTQRAGASAALYMESFVEPLMQELATSNSLSPENSAVLGRLLKDTPLGQRVLTFKIWGPGAVVVASSRPELVGKKFIPSEGLQEAWRGLAKAEFNNLKESENIFEQATGIPLLEVYVPLRARGSGKIIAVGEFYENENELGAELARVQRLSWLVVAGVTLSMLSALFAIVARGSRTIDQQRHALQQRIGELTQLVAENRALRSRVVQASATASESSEEYLRRFGADLHDGPAQLVSLAIMRLGDLDETMQAHTNRGKNYGARAVAAKPSMSVVAVLTTALRDLRNIANGLVLPEIEYLSLEETLASVVARHEKLTETLVELEFNDLPKDVPAPLKVCIYRFVQEGLSNAFRHGGGTGQAVHARMDNGVLELVVSDLGRVGSNVRSASKGPGLGLRGLTARIECLGGTLNFESRPGDATRLTAHIPLENVVPDER
jgi:signal transduction histidine kinase